MTKASVNLKPSYEAKPLAGKLAELAILAFTPIFAVLGILLLVRGRSASTPLASIEIITGSVAFGGSIILPIIMYWRLRKSKEHCFEFANSISDLIRHWAIVRISPLLYMAYCELFDGYYLELNPTSSDTLSFIIYKFLTPTQNVKKTPLFRTGKPDKQILPYRFLPFIRVPLKIKDFQKWAQQPERWKRTIAEDEELHELILTHSWNNSLLAKLSPSKRIISIHVAGYDTYFIHPLSKGQSIHGKSLGVSVIFYKIKMPSEKFETLQIFNKQLINIGKRILNRLAEGIETQQLEGKK